MRILFALTLLLAAFLSGSCTGGGMAGSSGSDTNLVINKESTETGTLRVDLQGPIDPTLLTLQYFIYGTNEDYGDNIPAPMQHLRLEEAGFVPLAYGEELLDVDLSPWGEYPFIYVRQLGALPNVSHRLTPGRHYLFNAHLFTSN